METKVVFTGVDELLKSLVDLAKAGRDFLEAATREKVVELRKEELPEVMTLRKDILLLTLRNTRSELQRKIALSQPRPRQAVKPGLKPGTSPVVKVRAHTDAPLTSRPLESLGNVVIEPPPKTEARPE